MQQQGINISQKRVWRLMKSMNIQSVIVKKHRYCSSSFDRTERPNILKQDFSSSKPNEKWVADITYIRTTTDGWTYLATVMDLCTRRIIGYKYSRKMTANIAIDALLNALCDQGYPEGVIVHSDCGSQYTSEAYSSVVSQYNLIQSFSKKGYPYDNACIESFHATLKKEEVYRQRYRNYHKASLCLFDFIEGWYNRNRIHSAIGYKTPLQLEEELKMQPDGTTGTYHGKYQLLCPLY